MDTADLDLEDLPPKALRKLIKSLLAKSGKPSAGKDADKADEEREALSDLHEQTNGKPTPIPVTEDDLPFDVGEDSESEEPSEDASEDSSVEDAPPAKKKKGK